MFSTKQISINAMGIALFVVMTMCLQVPVFENYYLCLGYIAMTFYLYYYGVVSGTLVGVVGVFLYCLLTSGLRGMPGWMLGNVVIGIVCGISSKIMKGNKNQIVKQIFMFLVVVISTAIGILVVKSVTECLLYSQPFALRIANNIYAFVADIVVLLVGFEICFASEPIMERVIEK